MCARYQGNVAHPRYAPDIRSRSHCSNNTKDGNCPCKTLPPYSVWVFTGWTFRIFAHLDPFILSCVGELYKLLSLLLFSYSSSLLRASRSGLRERPLTPKKYFL